MVTSLEKVNCMSQQGIADQWKGWRLDGIIFMCQTIHMPHSIAHLGVIEILVYIIMCLSIICPGTHSPWIGTFEYILHVIGVTHQIYQAIWLVMTPKNSGTGLGDEAGKVGACFNFTQSQGQQLGAQWCGKTCFVDWWLVGRVKVGAHRLPSTMRPVWFFFPWCMSSYRCGMGHLLYRNSRGQQFTQVPKIRLIYHNYAHIQHASGLYSGRCVSVWVGVGAHE